MSEKEHASEKQNLIENETLREKAIRMGRGISAADSVEIITSMIASTRRRLTKGEGNMLLFWGYLCVCIAIASILLGCLQFGCGIDLPFPAGFIWWLIPVIGLPYTVHVNNRNRRRSTVVTYTDRISNMLWDYVIWLAIAAIVIGMLFFISGFSVWYVIELFTFFVMGMAVSVQGIIIKEKSMIFGGAFSVVCGAFLVAGVIGGCCWLQAYSSLLFILSFLVMMIIPGHILNHKAKKEK